MVEKTEKKTGSKNDSLISKFLSPKVKGVVVKSKNFLKNLFEGKESVAKEINNGYKPEKKKKKKEKVKIKLNKDKLLGGLRRNTEEKQRQLDEIDKY